MVDSQTVLDKINKMQLLYRLGVFFNFKTFFGRTTWYGTVVYPYPVEGVELFESVYRYINPFCLTFVFGLNLCVHTTFVTRYSSLISVLHKSIGSLTCRKNGPTAIAHALVTNSTL